MNGFINAQVAPPARAGDLLTRTIIQAVPELMVTSEPIEAGSVA